ncbi:hypothetical protein FZ942_26395 [Azospirillum lipoferum]|uniref:Uncharacterized protein n=1 Tax=Azospirillum lipoferum TaxID=193 RepID=A0A5A9GEV3_AZOLI|nr:hypothetical protein FZ942_26395 [Azospirillum lipoferum]
MRTPVSVNPANQVPPADLVSRETIGGADCLSDVTIRPADRVNLCKALHESPIVWWSFRMIRHVFE